MADRARAAALTSLGVLFICAARLAAAGESLKSHEPPPDTPGNTILCTLPCNAAKAVVFSADGTVLLTAGGREARAWHARTLQPLTDVIRTDGDVVSARLSADGSRALIADALGAQVWDVSRDKPLAPVLKHATGVPLFRADLSPGGTRVLTAAAPASESGRMANDAFRVADDPTPSLDERQVHVWDAVTGERVTTLVAAGFVKYAA